MFNQLWLITPVNGGIYKTATLGKKLTVYLAIAWAYIAKTVVFYYRTLQQSQWAAEFRSLLPAITSIHISDMWLWLWSMRPCSQEIRGSAVSSTSGGAL